MITFSSASTQKAAEALRLSARLVLMTQLLLGACAGLAISFAVFPREPMVWALGLVVGGFGFMLPAKLVQDLSDLFIQAALATAASREDIGSIRNELEMVRQATQKAA